jgi:hypothetical protein
MVEPEGSEQRTLHMSGIGGTCVEIIDGFGSGFWKVVVLRRQEKGGGRWAGGAVGRLGVPGYRAWSVGACEHNEKKAGALGASAFGWGKRGWVSRF